MAEAIVREIRLRWKPRNPHSHKGDYGRVFVAAGSRGYSGAAYLCAYAAVKSGAGLVTLGVPEKIYTAVARRSASVIAQPFPSTASGSFSRRAVRPVLKALKNQNVLALGPGLSLNVETRQFVKTLCAQTHQPVVLDADGINAFQGLGAGLSVLKHRAILTPHPGEFNRVFSGALSAGLLSADSSDAVRKKAACEAAKKFGVYMILKGFRTVVASPDGECRINSTGNPGMASGGVGDVLTGVIAALVGQGFTLWEAARFGVYFHGLAGDLAVRRTGQIGCSAEDVAAFLPAAFKKVLGF